MTKHIEDGKKDLDKEKEEQLTKEGIQSEPILWVKIRLFELMKGHQEAEEKKVDIKLFEFDPTQEIKTGEQAPQGQKHLAWPCIYLNICHSEKVKQPLTKDRAFADLENDATWAVLPISYGKESETEEMIVYDAHLNSGIFKKCTKDKRILNSVLLVVLKRFQSLMANKYRLDIKNVHVVSTKYKSNDVNKEKPSLHLLMPDCDPKMHDDYVKKIKQFQKPDVQIPTIGKRPDEEEKISADEILKKLNMPGSGQTSTPKKPMIVEVDGVAAAAPKPANRVKPAPKPTQKGETIIQETVVKSIDEYNNQQNLKKLQKEEPKSSVDFNIEHKKGNMRVKIELPKEESAASVNVQLNETSFFIESGNYYWKKEFKVFHPQQKLVRVYHEPGEQGPKTAFSKAKKVLTVYLTEK